MSEKTEFREWLASVGLSQSECARKFGIPLRTIQNWATGMNPIPDYTLRMMQEITTHNKKEEKTMTIKTYNGSTTIFGNRNENGERATYTVEYDGDSLAFWAPDADEVFGCDKWESEAEAIADYESALRDELRDANADLRLSDDEMEDAVRTIMIYAGGNISRMW